MITLKRCDWRGMRHAWKRGKENDTFWWETPKERNHLEHLGLRGSALSKLMLKKVDGRFGPDSSVLR
jgi:hypothetical protein